MQKHGDKGPLTRPGFSLINLFFFKPLYSNSTQIDSLDFSFLLCWSSFLRLLFLSLLPYAEPVIK